MIIQLLFVVFVACAKSQDIEDDFVNPCKGETCGECIQVSPRCAWCGDEAFPRDRSRCDKFKFHQGSCKNIFYPQSEVTDEESKMYTSGDQSNDPVQVRPQKLEFTIRPNDPMTFKLKFQQQANYPVDLYFIMDLSFGMVREDAKDKLASLGQDIPDVMTDITNNFRLGFGTFVDKTVMPYVAWTPQLLKYRCPYKDRDCEKPHDFKNHLELGKDGQVFAKRMNDALEDVSQSMDDAEGGMDGLIQALDCNSIGWRKVSRRIIVYSSNSLFHLAGMGKLGGATKHSNLKCNLDSDGLYADEKVYDYPSVSQISSKLKEKKANVIFAVMNKVKPTYEQLTFYLDAAVVGELENDSTNIVQLIKDEYDKLRSRIQFQPKDSDNVDLKFRSKCLGNVMEETNICRNLKILDQVEFDVTMTVRKEICKDATGLVQKNVTVNAVGLEDKLDLVLNVLCACDCETRENDKKNPKCSGHGMMECGLCECNPGRYGTTCQCDETQLTSEESLQLCRMFPENSNVTCSGKGECACGVCHCYAIPGTEVRGEAPKKYTGQFCQCNDHSCVIAKNKKMCGGPSQGVCKCGKCSCLDGWSGHDCMCSTDNSTCQAQVQQEDGTIKEVECNGFGECKCGKCTCREDSGMVGPTCEECLTCNTRCSQYRECAQCKAHGTGLSETECTAKCKHTTVENTLPEGEGIRQCDGVDVDGCKFYYTYQYTLDNDVIVISQSTKKCPEDAPVMAIVGGIAAAIILIPLLLICLFIFIRNKRDAKEFAEFMKESEKAKWDSGANPIYKDPQTTFKNPTYSAGK